MYKLILTSVIALGVFVAACGDEDSGAPISEAPTDASTPTASSIGGDGTGGTFSSSKLPISVTVTTPDGWEQPSDADLPDLFAVVSRGFGYIDFLQPTEVYNRPSATESVLAGPPADYVTWFNENPFAIVLGAEPTTLANLQGTRMEIANDDESFGLFKLSDGSDYDLSYLDHIYTHVLDAGGTQIIVSCGVERGADFAELAEVCGEILATVQFGT